MCHFFKWLEADCLLFIGLTDLHLVAGIRASDQWVEWTWTCSGIGEICAGNWGEIIDEGVIIEWIVSECFGFDVKR